MNLTESKFVVVTMSVKWDCHHIKTFKTTKDFIKEIQVEFADYFEDNRNEPTNDEELHETIFNCLELGHDCIYNGGGESWAVVIRCSDGTTWGEMDEDR